MNARPNANGSYTINGRSYAAASVGQMKGEIDSANRRLTWASAGAMRSRPPAGASAWIWAWPSRARPRPAWQYRLHFARPPCAPKIANDVAAENAKLADEVKDLKIYPVIRVGLSYRF